MSSLKEALERRRDLATEYLLLNGSYEKLRKELTNYEITELKKCFKDTDLQYEGGGCKTKKLLLGMTHKIQHRQRAILELPTHELVYALEKIIEKLGYTEAHEINSGTGILSFMINALTTIQSAPYSSKNTGYFSGETYCKVEKKHIMQFVTNPVEDDSIHVFNHTSYAQWEVIGNILRNKPKAAIFIGQFYEEMNDYEKIKKIITDKNYHYVCLPIKQICYLDTFGLTPELDKHCSKSQVVVMIRKTDPPIDIEDNTLEKWKEILGDELMGDSCMKDIEIKSLLINYWLNGYISGKVLHLTFEENMFKCNLNDKALNSLAVMTSNVLVPYKGILHIPKYLYSTEEIIFWDDLDKINKWPKLVKDRNTFEEFRKLYIGCDTKWKHYQKCKIIPKWVTNAKTAKDCIINLYSSNSSKWRVKPRNTGIPYNYNYGYMAPPPVFGSSTMMF